VGRELHTWYFMHAANSETHFAKQTRDNNNMCVYIMCADKREARGFIYLSESAHTHMLGMCHSGKPERLTIVMRPAQYVICIFVGVARWKS
jgi:hypothetical protein